MDGDPVGVLPRRGPKFTFSPKTLLDTESPFFDDAEIQGRCAPWSDI